VVSIDFIPLAVQAVLHLRTNCAQRVERVEAYSDQEIDVLVHGMLQDELESILRDVFQRADPNDDLGFSRREVNTLMANAPVHDDDPSHVAYHDFTPVCFSILRDLFVHGIIELPSDQESIAHYLVEVFTSGDVDGTGLLPVSELVKLIRVADIGLTRLQIISLMSEAQEDASGFVNYEKFATHVAGMALVLTNFDSQQTFVPYLHTYRKTNEYYTVLEMNQYAFEVRACGGRVVCWCCG